MGKIITLGQVMILLLGVIAISYAVGGEIGIVEAGPGPNVFNPNFKTNIKPVVSNLNSPTQITKTQGAGFFSSDKYTIDGNVVTQEQWKQVAMGKIDPKIIEVTSDGKLVGQTTSITPTTSYLQDAKTGEVFTGDLTPSEALQLNKNGFNEITSTEYGKTAEWGFSEGIGGHLKTGLWQAALTQQIVQWITRQGPWGFDDAQSVTLGEGAGVGVLAYHITQGGIEQWYSKLYAQGNTGWGVAAGVVIAAYYIYENYEDLDTETATFACVPWEAPVGGQHCERCNNKLLGCSEYQCRSLGKGCELLNPGSSEELCTWMNRDDVEAPDIRPWNSTLVGNNTKYTPDSTISPPDKGVKIINKTGIECIPAYTPLRFGVTLDEPATCKIDFTRKDKYEDMKFYFGSNSLARYNHSHTMSLPSLNATGTVIESGLNATMYVRCEDANGNSNLANFVFKFCVDEGKDFTPPTITSTSIPNNQPVAYNIGAINFSIFVNERGQPTCKWDHSDKSYDRMDNTFGTCVKEIRNAQEVYSCKTELNAIKDREENDFYFRCNDTVGNKNRESTKITLVGTQPLFIDWIKPEGIVKDSTSPVKLKFEVKTSSGYQDGNAFCFYKPSASTGSYVQFQYEPVEMTHQHTQDLVFTGSSTGIEYNYSIKCIDAGGNLDVKEMIFKVETDIGEPVVSRAYREEGYLKIITNEAGECVYNTVEDIGCQYEFGDGVEMDQISEDEHIVEWNTQETFYIKCKDSYGNPPSYNSCSIIARHSEGETL